MNNSLYIQATGIAWDKSSAPPEPPYDERCHCITPTRAPGWNGLTGWGVTACWECKGFVKWGVRP